MTPARAKMSDLVMIVPLVRSIEQLPLSISPFFSSLGKMNRHHIPFFGIPISMEALTRARYMYIQTYTYNTFSLICLFFLSLSHSFIRFSPSSMFLHVLQATTNYCMSVKAKLVLTNRNIVCDRCICMCVDRPTTVTIE